MPTAGGEEQPGSPGGADDPDSKRARRDSFGPWGDPKKKYLYYCPQMAELAASIAQQQSSLKIELGEISWKRFPDGFPNVFVEGAETIRGKHVAFLASFNNPETIFEQISVIYSLPKMFIASFTLILPFFPTGTAERVEREGEVPTAVTLARILSHIPLSRGGPTSTIIFDIHALQERFYFGDNITPCFETGIPLLLKELAELEDAKDVVIAYPDEGAMKRFHTMFVGFEEVVCTKDPATLTPKSSIQYLEIHYLGLVGAARGQAPGHAQGGGPQGQARGHCRRPGAIGRHTYRVRQVAAATRRHAH